MMEYSEKEICCFTGKRKIPQNNLKAVEDYLKNEVKRAISEGYKVFLSGFAEGVDLLAAKIISEEKQENAEIKLIAMLPYASRGKAKEIQELLKECEEICVISEKNTRDCYYKRNRAMIDRASLVIAVTDQEATGGTGYTIRYAEKSGKNIRKMILLAK